MKKVLFTLFLTFFFIDFTHAQVGVNTVTPNAMLDIKASNQATPANTDGILIPKIDAFPVVNPTAAQKGMLVYLTTLSGGNPPGFYYWNNPGWVGIVSGSAGGTLDQAYDFGGAGLGKTITADTGAVTVAGTDGLVATGTSGSGALAPSGAGTRMVWNPNKAAFRAGNVSGAQWDDVNIGIRSIAFGGNSTASGSNATALGFNTVASATSSTAFGSTTTASGNTSTAFGFATTAGGTFSSSFGFGTTAPSFGETVLGIGATTYTPSVNGDTQFRVANATDRLLVVGNAIDANNSGGIDAGERSDALVILKNGNTGIGSSTPADKLHVVGNIRMVDGNQAAGKVLTSDANGSATWQSATANVWSLTGNTGTNSNTNFLGTTDNRAVGLRTNGREALKIESDGTLYIGMPQAGFQTITSGPSGISIFESQTEGTKREFNFRQASNVPTESTSINFNRYRNTISINTAVLDGDELGRINFKGAVLTGGGAFGFAAFAASIQSVVDGAVASPNVPGRLNFLTTPVGTNVPQLRMTVRSNGNVGINADTPAERLHVVGNIRMVDGNQAAGRVLTSDANGTATWQTPAAAGTTLDGAYDFGGAGAGRTITADTGAVTIAGTDGLVSTGTLGSGATAPAGAGTRMVWNPNKAAFRAGNVSGAQWDDVNIGFRSIAFGGNSTASGSNAAALGFNTVASATSSTAFGSTTTASGNTSTAFGFGTTAGGTFSTSFGFGTTAPSFGETVLGIGATTYTPSLNGDTQFRVANATDRLLVVGNAIDANNSGGIDAGERSDALVILKNGNTGIGSSTPQDKLHVVGNIRMVDGNQATGKVLTSDANGTATWQTPAAAGTTLDGAYDFGGSGAGRTITADTGAVTIAGNDGLVSTGTTGSGAVAPSGAGTRMVWNPRKAAFRAGIVNGTQWDDANLGSNSVAFGTGTTANATNSFAFGNLSSASGVNSFAFGNVGVASGSNSVAFGIFTSASARTSTAFGESTVASGQASTAFGQSNSALSYGETALGIGATSYIPAVNGATQFRTLNATDRLLVVGNAIDANNNDVVDAAERSDALVILKNGLTRLPSTTNAMITAADGKAIVTKEYLAANTSGTLDQAYDFGGAGAGRTITADTGAVTIAGTDGLVSTGTSGSGAVAPSGAGTRMVWNPNKAAFRAGNVTATQWDDANIGLRSMAFGNSTIASGDTAIAFGTNTTASGDGSTAFGFGPIASGITSTAFGASTTASGGFSTAFGAVTTASGNSSTVFGQRNTAPSFGETVFGIGATTYTPTLNGDTQFRAANVTDRLLVVGNALDANNNSTVDLAERRDALIILKNGLTRLPSTTNAMITASDGKAVVTKEYLAANTSGTLDQAYDFGGAGAGRMITADTGAVTIAGTDGLVSTGTSGSGAVAPSGAGTRMVWNPNKAAFRAGNVTGTQWDDANIGFQSVAFGASSIASGGQSMAFGSETQATSIYATAFGRLTSAQAPGATAFGIATVASGNLSTAFGSTTIASGTFSTAFGALNTASGERSTAFGSSNTAPSFGETVLGIGATTYTPTANGDTQFRVANVTDRLLVVGNATDTNNNGTVDVAERSNAFVILKNGNTGIGSITPVTSLDVVGAMTVRPVLSNAITADNQVVTVGNNGNIWIQSNSFVAGARTITLTDGLILGQMLTLVNSAAGIFEVADDDINNNTNTLGGGRTLGQFDVITMMWNGFHWMEVSFANN